MSTTATGEFDRSFSYRKTAIVGFDLTPAVALFVMTWDNIINVFVQPWVGARSDSTWNRFGRRKPWIILGLPIAVIGFVLIPFAQTALVSQHRACDPDFAEYYAWPVAGPAIFPGEFNE